MNEYSFILWHDSAMAATAKNLKRTATREKRRRQLVDATIKCIARKGMGSTTLGDVAGEAGLSQGIVNLHFESKDNLLNETLTFIAEEYRIITPVFGEIDFIEDAVLVKIGNFHLDVGVEIVLLIIHCFGGSFS